MNKEISLIKNIISGDQAGHINNVLYDQTFPWYFLNSSSGLSPEMLKNGESLVHYSFYHLLYLDGHITSDYINIVDPILEFMKENINFEKILRIRIGMQTKVSMDSSQINLPHTDYTHKNNVLLYYVDDSDGDTVFYDKEYDPEEKDVNLKEKLRITPEQGSAAIFNGLLYHSSSHPVKKDRRIAINFNYIGESI